MKFAQHRGAGAELQEGSKRKGQSTQARGTSAAEAPWAHLTRKSRRPESTKSLQPVTTGVKIRPDAASPARLRLTAPWKFTCESEANTLEGPVKIAGQSLLMAPHGKREKSGAGRNDHILLAIQAIRDRRRVYGCAQLDMPEVLSGCGHRVR